MTGNWRRTMRRRARFLWVLAALLLAGCSLARPEAGRQGEDPWVGFRSEERRVGKECGS